VIGKPCDIAAVHKAQQEHPELRTRIGATIAFFCAGTPTTAATFDLLKRLGVDDPADVVDIRYRGNGWPGKTAVTVRTRNGLETRKLTYEEAWGGILTNRKQWRCHVCADHTGEFADIAVGDPWYRAVEPGEPGRSLILVRTERGRRLLKTAIERGYITAERADPQILPRSQRNLLRGRGAVWARLVACRLLGVATPRYRGFPMFRFWWSQLTLSEKLRSLAGTARRVRRRGLRRRIRLQPFPVAPRKAAPEISIESTPAASRAAA
jgi:coenzyme F420 hydrogenase subunit beta